MRRLMDAGKTLFTEFGYEVTTIDQITSLAGVSRAAFYLHFETKADIIRALVIDVSHSLEDRYAALAKLGPSPTAEAVTQWIRELLQACRSDGTTLLLHRTIHPGSNLFDEIAFYDAMIELLGTGYPRFAATKSDPFAKAGALLFFFQLQALIRQLTTGDRLDWDSLCQATAQYFLSFSGEGKR
jgi:AcrR family transcriptional regulator